MIKGKTTDVFFDLDHTLWDFDKNSEIAFDVIFKEKHQSINTQHFIQQYIPINQACWKLYQNDEITHEVLRYNRLKHSFDAINYSINDYQINEIAEKYIDLLPQNNHLFDGTIEILEYLKPKYKLHIITNGFAEVQTKKMCNSKIENYFQTITNSEMAGAKKPNPMIFEYALNKSNAQKHSSVMIGDSIEADVLGAINFGIRAIFFNPNQQNIDQNVTQIKHLLELKKYL